MKWIRNRKRRMILSLAAALLVGTMMNMGIDAQEIYEKNEGKEYTDLFGNETVERLNSHGKEANVQQLFPKESQNLTPLYAWWGTLYPKFAFSERKAGKVKISFWLAKALEWW